MDPLSTTPSPVVKPKAGKTIVIAVGFIVSGLLAALGGYWFGGQNTSTTVTPLVPQVADTTPENTVHFVTSVGYPLGTDQQLTVKLGVPGELQAVKVNSSIQDPGLLTTLAGGIFNSEMGRWQLGRPTTSDNDLDEISLIHVNKEWLASNTIGNEHFSHGPPYELPLPTANMTAAQKQTFIAELKSATEKCATNPKNGFVIAKTINVCLKVSQVKQAEGSYYPYVDINGYGVIDGVQLIFGGSINLRDDKTYSYEKETALQGEFTPEKLPADTQSVLDRYVAALKTTTLVLEKKQ